MKRTSRFAGILAAAATVIIWTPLHAETNHSVGKAPPAAVHAYMRAIQKAYASPASARSSLSLNTMWNARSVMRAHEGQTAASLALPDSVVTSIGNGKQSQVAADAANFKNLHSENTGYQSRDAASFDFSPTALIQYQGSVFDNAQDATAYANDGLKGVSTTQQGKPADCSQLANGSLCQVVAFTYTGNYDGLYSVAAINQCVIEAGFILDPNATSDQENAISKATAAVFVTGIQEAQKACTAASTGTSGQSQPTATATSTATSSTAPTATPQPTTTPTAQPSITIDQTLIIHQVKGNAKATSSLKSKEKGLFVAVYHTANAGTLTPTGTITFTVNGKSLGQPDALTPAKLDNGTTFMGTYETFTVKKKAVKVVAHFHLVLGTATADATRSFKVKPKK